MARVEMTRRFGRAVALAAIALLAEKASAGAGARVVRTTFLAQSLVGNRAGESPTRSVTVVLPPGYDEAPSTRYPAVYLLHAWDAGPDSFLGRGYEGLDLSVALRTAIEAGRIGPMIFVLPDARTKLGGYWYTNSVVGGAWEDFVAQDVVGHVDASYRTIADRKSRAIAGQSMGAYGALRIAIDAPDTFGAVVAISAPNLVEPNPFGDDAARSAAELEAGTSANASPLARVLWSKAIAFSPAPGRAPFQAELPWTLVEGKLVRNEAVWDRWQKSALAASVPQRAGDLKRLRIEIDVGDQDPLLPESRAFVLALASASIDHAYFVFPGDHVRGVRARFETGVLDFFERAFRGQRATPTPSPSS
jgi:enterochelin esterase-like enzyme